MENNFERLITGVTQIYKKIQKIKKHKMNSMGLKGTHVMCIYYLNRNPAGLTASDLCELCREDKAGISRTLADLESGGFITYDMPANGKKYRSKATLTEKGETYSRKVKELAMQASMEAGRGISEEEREIFYRVLFMISDNLECMCAILGED